MRVKDAANNTSTTLAVSAFTLDAAAPIVNQAHYFLQATAGGGYEANTSAPHGVGETQRDSSNQARAALRAHHQQTAYGGQLLEARFILQRDPTAKKKHIPPGLNRFERFSIGILARHRDADEVGLWERKQTVRKGVMGLLARFG